MPGKSDSLPREAAPISTRPLLWLNLVCLDAPLVAVSWLWLFARNLHRAVSLPGAVALFLTAWLIYLVDRWAHSISLPPASAVSPRGQFCSRHKRIWAVVIAVVALLDAAIIFSKLDHRTIVYGLGVGMIAAIYLAVNHFVNQFWRTIPLKEITVGTLFAAGTLLIFASTSSSSFSATMDVAALLFACLCFLNCVSIARWERDLDIGQGKTSMATRWPVATRHTRTLLGFLAGACVVLALFDPGLWSLALCLGLSALCLLALDLVSVKPAERTALADLVLLTPLLILLIE